MNERENNIDLLRLISCIGVIIIHASSAYKSGLIADNVFIGNPGFATWAILFFNVIPRFSVGCFFLISGAFILQNKKNEDLKYFYRKTFLNIFVPAFVFYLLYFIFSEALAVFRVIKQGYPTTVMLESLIDLLKGIPSSHLWTMTVLFVIYLFVPFIIKVKEKLGAEAFRKLSVFYFIIALFSGHTSYYTFYWSIGIVLDYLALFVLGDTIRSSIKNKKKSHAVIGVIIAVICLAATLVIQYKHTLMGIQEYAETFPLIDPLSPLVCLSSLSMFYAFLNMTVNRDIHHLSKHSFMIYLVHAGIIDAFVLLNERMTVLPADSSLAIPLLAFVTFWLSLLASIIFNRILSFLQERFNFGGRLYLIVFPLLNKIDEIYKRIF